jgi:hypothetical protein
LRFQAILINRSNVHRILLAATLPGSRHAGSPHESVLSQKSCTSDWNSL